MSRGLYTVLKCLAETQAQGQALQSHSQKATLDGYDRNSVVDSLVIPCTNDERLSPLPRTLHSACVDPTRKSLYIFGGRLCATHTAPKVLNDLHEFSFTTMSWTQKKATTPIQPRCGATLTFRSDAVIVLFGGMLSNGKELNEIQILDLALVEVRWSRVYTTNNPKRRSRHFACTSTNDHDLLVFGGVSDDVVLADCHILSFTTGTWREITFTNGPGPTLGCNVCCFRKSLYVFCTNQRFAVCPLSEMISDTAARPSWHIVGSTDNPPNFRVDHTLTSVGPRVLLLGGKKVMELPRKRGLFNPIETATGMYTAGTQLWDILEDFPSVVTQRMHHTTSAVNEDCALVFGGCNTNDLVCVCLRPKTSVNTSLQVLQTQARESRWQLQGNLFDITVKPFYNMTQYVHPADYDPPSSIRYALKSSLTRARRRITVLMGYGEKCHTCQNKSADIQTLYCGHIFLCQACFSLEKSKACPACGKKYSRFLVLKPQSPMIRLDNSNKSMRRPNTALGAKKTSSASLLKDIGNAVGHCEEKGNLVENSTTTTTMVRAITPGPGTIDMDHASVMQIRAAMVMAHQQQSSSTSLSSPMQGPRSSITHQHEHKRTSLWIRRRPYFV